MRYRHFDERYRKLITCWDTHSPISESFRAIRASLNYSFLDDDLKSILFTSVDEGEGKSLTSANLAVVMAQAGYKTVYVDADLRKGSGHKIFHLPNIHGLTSYLIKALSMEEVILESRVHNLSVVPSGPIPPHPAELLDTVKMKSFLRTIHAQYDRVIIDTSPMLVSDPIILAKQVDGCILVVHAKKTKRDRMIKAQKQLNSVHARVFGVVLNHANRKNNDSYPYE